MGVEHVEGRRARFRTNPVKQPTRSGRLAPSMSRKHRSGLLWFVSAAALFRVSCLQKLRNFHEYSAQALVSDAEVEFKQLARLAL